jgi:hypothetical protein
MPQLLLTERQADDASALFDYVLDSEYTHFRECMCEAGCLQEFPGLTEEEQEELQYGSRFSEHTRELIRKAAMCPDNMHPYALAYRLNELVCLATLAQATGEPLLMEQYTNRLEQEKPTNG